MKQLFVLEVIALLVMSACNNKPMDVGPAKFQPGEIVKLKLTGEDVLVLDTPIHSICGCNDQPDYAITFNHANYHAKEVELEAK